MDKLQEAGCLFLYFTGGEPLMRKDLPEIYLYAKKKGFLISLFTNGTLITKEWVDLLKKYPPFSIEITLHSIQEKTFDRITQREGSFQKVMEAIHLLYQYKIPLILKTVGLTLNREEILETKRFIRNMKGVYYKFDSLIIPRLDGNTAPLNFRLTPEEIVEIETSDEEFRTQIRKVINGGTGLPAPYQELLYPCYNRNGEFLIDPAGRLQYCLVERSFNINLLERDWESLWEKKVSSLHAQKLPPTSPCYACNLRRLCPQCPGRNRLLGKDIYTPIQYYCALARERFINREKYLEEANV